jgi:hypothetical protein
MTTSSGNPFTYSSTMAQNNGAMPNQSASRMALDNLIRRELKVSDPSDANQVAQALLSRYKDNPRATAIAREAEGVPFLLTTPMAAPMPQAMRSSDTEWQQAVDDVERDLHALTNDAILKDIRPELQGWTMAIRSAIADGANAARYAIDTRRRDVAFGIRRTLGDYARMARLVGALTPGVTINYRKFAQSLDEVASVLLVMMGEALANIGFNGGRYLLQAPYSELQVRRDSTIYALRNLTGSTQEAYDTNNWPRGLDAYRQLFDFLEKQGQGDLRALLVETELVRMMDALIQRSAQGSAEGLRQLGSTAQLDVERLRRFVIVVNNAISPASPPLVAFLEALQLFVDAFDSAGGSRLLKIARPPVLFYGLYGTSGLEKADRRLLEMIIQRGLLADQLDCFAQCGCNSDSVKCQIVLDKILYDVDRAIDLYAVGQYDSGNPELRAGAYGYVIQAFLGGAEIQPNPPSDNDPPELPPLTNCLNPQISSPAIVSRIRDALTKVRNKLLPIATFPMSEPPEQSDPDRISPLTDSKMIQTFRDLVIQEIRIQKDLEQRWQNLVKSMAADCVPFENTFAGPIESNQVGVFGITTQVLNEAIRLAARNDARPSELAPFNRKLIDLPLHYEFGLEDIKRAIRNEDPVEPPENDDDSFGGDNR